MRPLVDRYSTTSGEKSSLSSEPRWNTRASTLLISSMVNGSACSSTRCVRSFMSSPYLFSKYTVWRLGNVSTSMPAVRISSADCISVSPNFVTSWNDTSLGRWLSAYEK